MKYTLTHIAEIVGSASAVPAINIENLLLDSRKVYSPSSSLFFALTGPRRDGHQFIAELYKKGVRNFVVSEEQDAALYPNAYFVYVTDTLKALQQLTIYHRNRFEIPVIGITGSNGKTIVKEWLYQLLHEDFHVVRSPKSYNSQIGVPLSVWQMDEQHTLAIFEAGISQPGEMETLEKIIEPTIGILTNIGEAHNEGFTDKDQKLAEKLKLFSNCQLLVGRESDLTAGEGIISSFETRPETIMWGASSTDNVSLKHIDKKDSHTIITVCTGGAEKKFIIPFNDDASVENSITCYVVLLQFGISHEVIAKRMQQLQPVNMRLELKKGINHCTIINDSYSADLNSLEIALNFLSQQQGQAQKTVILSDLLQSARSDDQLYHYIIEILQK
ncbi:MAG TPA: Mur ligase family protein, partial [Chitinophagaceae bacterium]|nr:Mur ligase family protein [Chitinophagaceae bacterium]